MSKKLPKFVAYTVKEREKGQQAIWTRIGAAWPHRSSNGLTVELNAFPVDGRLVLIEPKADAGHTESFEAEAAGDRR